MADTTPNWAAIEDGANKVVAISIAVGIIGFVMLIADVGPWLPLLTATIIVFTVAVGVSFGAKANAKLER